MYHRSFVEEQPQQQKIQDMILRKNIFAFFRQIKRSHSALSVDSSEVDRFGRLSDKWFDEQGPFKALHSLNKLRVPWILKNLPKVRSYRFLFVQLTEKILSNLDFSPMRRS